MVKIRLTQIGSANRRTYRVIAIEESKRRGGREIEILGSYNPLIKPAKLAVDRERIAYWVSVGAQMTPSAKKLLETSAIPS